jgi:microcystin-dependent protein
MGAPVSDQYIGEMRLFAGSYAPSGWHFCDGSLLSIATYDTLYALLGTTYGGDGQSTFGLPDLRARTPVSTGTRSGDGVGFALGQVGGAAEVTLTTLQMPNHTHAPSGSSDGAVSPNPSGRIWGTSAVPAYVASADLVTMHSSAIGATGGSQPHSNRSPYVAINYIIATYGIYPSAT